MNPLPVAQWDNRLQNVIDDMGGSPLNIHALMANHPPLLSAWWDLRMYLVNGGDLGQRHCELAILRIAVHLKNWYEWGSHVVRGLDSGLSPDEIDRVVSNTGNWSEADAALLAAVDEIVSDNRLSEASLERLAPHFTDRQVMDLMHLHGMYRTIACLIETWGLELDAAVVEQLPDKVSEATFHRNVT
ncbi:MAG: carboxymuconolactone decarboxylase family protein [Woeseiaceae bacterium]|nr:carboxymuconolactone decarboxylase family protein [Woeseiaceae bacterium]